MARDENRGERQKAARRSPPCSRLFAGFLSGFGNRRNTEPSIKSAEGVKASAQEGWQYNQAIDYCQDDQRVQGEILPFGMGPRVFSSADVILSPAIAELILISSPGRDMADQPHESS